MAEPENNGLLPGDADFDTAVADPAAYYAEPEDVAADADLTTAQKRRFLTEWAQDIERRQSSEGEGMAASTPAEPTQDAQRLQRIQASLETLPESDAEPAPDSTFRRAWRRLVSG